MMSHSYQISDLILQDISTVDMASYKLTPELFNG